MNPEDETSPSEKQLKQPHSITRPRPPKVQSKLKQKISESKMLQILDHDLDDANNQDDECELVCDSTMVEMDDKDASRSQASPEALDRRGVLQTIRSMHKLQQQQHQQRPQQVDQ
ncbi:unnamed protein product [Aphanomyces euteiches]|nr:hypothetical protein Ae201684P_018139 [Aphanomyces euteiches]KAH9106955.1 hypothetical protein AeMF1_017587 [Aphanomyces euteiches]KAH9145669.1 hypothetical protein AeRB84_010432 [Aphanomyces euteiches]KAH9146956.1 hypothetical protein LEN26_004848 [Aphanomyces euteiches]KAH9182867.1 hypothetical protein AeNC1_015160 [Aphanomyces euteiches]